VDFGVDRNDMLSLRPGPLADPGRWLYELLAPVYDRVSGEAPLYSTARARTIELLQLRPGATVIDVACGTGRNHEHIQQCIGPAGRLVGVDRSAAMLRRARERAAHHRWSNVELVETDVTNLTPGLFDEGGNAPPSAGFDAVLCTLGLSVISDWRSAWQAMLALVRPGGRIAIMDAGYPAKRGQAGEAVALRPVAWLLCRLFAADPRRQPWELVGTDTDDPTAERHTWGYIGVAAGTVRAPEVVEDGDDRVGQTN
jgi:demethylmenaquinone methyltransferase/2-methoxy-6-polyprenyl-1,4-benzoquinol methylase